jgi:hypothetical protein
MSIGFVRLKHGYPWCVNKLGKIIVIVAFGVGVCIRW